MVGKTWASPRGMWPTNAASLFRGPLAPHTSVWSVHVVGTQAITTSTCDSPASTRSQDLIQLQSVMSQATRSMANGRILPRTSCLTLMLAVGTLVLLQIVQQQCTTIMFKTEHPSQLVVTGLLPTAGLWASQLAARCTMSVVMGMLKVLLHQQAPWSTTCSVHASTLMAPTPAPRNCPP